MEQQNKEQTNEQSPRNRCASPSIPHHHKRVRVRFHIVHFNENSIEIHFTGDFSVNKLYINTKNGKRYNQVKTKIYEIMQIFYQDVLSFEFKKCNRYVFIYEFYFCNNKKRDISNYIKFFEDFVFKLLIKDDDSKVFEIHAYKKVMKRNMHVVKISWDEKR